MNIALCLAYDGTRYHGWQIQPNGDTIQQQLETALAQLLGKRTHVIGVGRTDAGVHAKRYVASFRADCSVPMDRLPLAINALLPEDIAVSAACLVPEEFHASFSCTKKEYAYYLYPSRLRDPFLSHRAYRYPYPLDIERMQAGALRFVGKQDFAAVRAMGTPVKSTVRTVFWCQVEPWRDGLIRIRVCGDGFLYNMVRAIAGTLVYAGTGKLTPDAITAALQSKRRALAGPTLPACGLFMNRLWYDDFQVLDAFSLHPEDD